ncbi:conjugal transfer protein [Paenibacillus stellifer]|uniref:Conjugal transfer protein n=1 Tax=Paenibacillus stellifer TaxID=169760 RepID=A0A089LLZ9_9BACL|nr:MULTISPECIES: SHOCT domain-containing protein [Paenibacillus]AIQ62556.1 conjugal transfer protein [Paenibacillus stellifer]HUC93293.1 SHOCT domain-containing protein [Paenibacillus sp.]
MNQKLIRYSMQIAMMKQLLALSLITESEFNQIKSKTMREYGIISDLTS